MKAGFIEVERLLLLGDTTGAQQVVESICKEDPKNYGPVKDRFMTYLITKNLTAAVENKKGHRLQGREEALRKWHSLFKDVNAI